MLFCQRIVTFVGMYKKHALCILLREFRIIYVRRGKFYCFGRSLLLFKPDQTRNLILDFYIVLKYSNRLNLKGWLEKIPTTFPRSHINSNLF